MDPQPPVGAHHPPGKGGGLGGWIKRNKGPAAAVGVLGVVAIITIAKKGSASSAAGTSGTAGTTSATGVQPGVYGYGGDTTGDSYAAEMSQLQDFLNAYTAGTAGSQLFPNGLPASAPAPSSGSKPPTYTVTPKPPILTPSRTAAQTISVPKGASLLSLSRKYLGTSNRTELAHANNLGTGAGLAAGQRLIIPAH